MRMMGSLCMQGIDDTIATGQRVVSRNQLLCWACRPLGCLDGVELCMHVMSWRVQGRTVDFKNTLIIMTSNVGSSVIEKGGAGLGFQLDFNEEDSSYNRIKTLVNEELKQYFRYFPPLKTPLPPPPPKASQPTTAALYGRGSTCTMSLRRKILRSAGNALIILFPW
jgi:hypothetical protein